MKIYHSTTKKNAIKILKTKNIKESNFDIWGFLDFWMDHLKNSDIDESGNLVPSRYIANRKSNYIYWLGKGIYGFKEEDFEEAINYSEDHDVIIAITTDNVDIFEMSSSIVIAELQRFFIDEFQVFLETRNFSDEEIETYDLIREILVDAIYDNFSEAPQAAGIVLEIYNILMNKEIKLASNVFTLFKGNPSRKVPVEYLIIKNKSIIREIEGISI